MWPWFLWFPVVWKFGKAASFHPRKPQSFQPQNHIFEILISLVSPLQRLVLKKWSWVFGIVAAMGCRCAAWTLAYQPPGCIKVFSAGTSSTLNFSRLAFIHFKIRSWLVELHWWVCMMESVGCGWGCSIFNLLNVSALQFFLMGKTHMKFSLTCSNFLQYTILPTLSLWCQFDEML